MSDLDLFDDDDLPPPPTGPAAEVPGHAANTRAAYAQWRASDDGVAVVGYVELSALARFAAGDKRISVRILVGQAREELRRAVNDRYCPWIADDLIRQHPGLLDVIERRRRRRHDG